MAKFFIFYNAFAQKFFWLILIAVLNSLIAVYYYLNLTIKIYMEKHSEFIENKVDEGADRSFYLLLTMCVAAVMTLFVGIYPEPVLRIAKSAIFKIF